MANLLENRIKYAAGSDVRMTAPEQAGQVVITVAGAGPGLPPDALERFHQRSYRL